MTDAAKSIIKQYQEAVDIIMTAECLCDQMGKKWGDWRCPNCIAKIHLASALRKCEIQISLEGD